MTLGMKSMDIGKSASAAELVFEAVRKAIIEGELYEGEPLRQDELARLFNTSRIPVREALTILEQQGLVKTVRFKGAVVAGHSLEEASEIFDFRALLEAEVIRQAVPNMTPKILQNARVAIEQFSKVTDPMEYGDLNREFHETLYRASGLTYHMSLIVNSMDRIDRHLRAQLVISEGTKRANLEHLNILSACENGNAHLASQLTAEHILGAKHSLIKRIQEMTQT